MLYVLYVHVVFEWAYIKRAEAVALLKELGAEELIHPSLVLIEKSFPDIYQLKLKGDYDILEIGILLKDRFLIEESEKYLVISSL